MKDQRDLQGSARGRFNQARRIVAKVWTIVAKDAREVTDAEMAELREQASTLVQAVHEFNAYRNALEWNDRQVNR